jgi:hypothetical protein
MASTEKRGRDVHIIVEQTSEGTLKYHGEAEIDATACASARELLKPERNGLSRASGPLYVIPALRIDPEA